MRIPRLVRTDRTDERWRPQRDDAAQPQDVTTAPARTSSLRLVAGTVLLAGVVVVAALYSSSTRDQPGTVLELGQPGQVQATYLRDGSPVFVVHGFDGAAHVVSAVDPAARGVVTWCGDTRTFVETGGTSRWDEQGRYLFGPAGSGLALHEAVQNPDGATVQAGPRLRPRPLSDDPRPVSEEGRCYSSGGSGGLRHQRADMAAQPLDRVTGNGFTRVDATLVISPEGAARLCPAAGCSRRSRTVRSTFHGTAALHDYVGQARGEFLVRVTRQETLEELVDLDGVLATLPMAGEPTPFSPADLTAEIVEVVTSSDGAQLVMARPASPRPVFPDGPPAAPQPSRSWPLADDATIISLTTQGQYPYADFLTVAELQEMLATRGSLAAEVHLDGHGVAVSVRPVSSAGPCASDDNPQLSGRLCSQRPQDRPRVGVGVWMSYNPPPNEPESRTAFTKEPTWGAGRLNRGHLRQ